jgi:hypothetical protein
MSRKVWFVRRSPRGLKACALVLTLSRLEGLRAHRSLKVANSRVPLTGRQDLLPRVGDEHLQERPIHAVTAPRPLGGMPPILALQEQASENFR